MSLISYDEQIYLIGYYLENNIIPIQEALNVDKVDIVKLRVLIRDSIETELDITPGTLDEITDKVLKSWEWHLK